LDAKGPSEKGQSEVMNSNVANFTTNVVAQTSNVSIWPPQPLPPITGAQAAAAVPAVTYTFTGNAAGFVGNMNPAIHAAAPAYCPPQPSLNFGNLSIANNGPIYGFHSLNAPNSADMQVTGNIKCADTIIDGISVKLVIELLIERLGILIPEPGDLQNSVLQNAYKEYKENETEFYKILTDNPKFKDLKLSAEKYKMLKQLIRPDSQ